jgi:hypothetical protein
VKVTVLEVPAEVVMVTGTGPGGAEVAGTVTEHVVC